MKIGEKLYGFVVEEAEFLKEIDATMYKLRHEKHGTPLIFLDRDDSNKSFYIGFKTLPTDDTGVFHIIEHSVLCGSRKYPVKEPFVELLKSSLKTFLNAMTYPDRTVYPVSSRCDKDFHNLVDIYMDAVFHPLMLENEFIFMQEGHRAELNAEEDAIFENGVVFNEMKGAASSQDELSANELTKLLYKGTVYEKDSGGDPDAIPSLTYEGFKEAHKKYYHPANAYIFLDGRVALDDILPLLDSYLSEFGEGGERFYLGDEPEFSYGESCVEYELAPDEDPKNKTGLYLGYRTADFDDAQTIFELSVLTDAIAGSNEAPFKKAMLDSGLLEDVSIFPLGDGIKFGSYAIELKNVKDGCAEQVFSLAEKTFSDLAASGIDRELLEASLNMREFRLREKDFGSLPRGLVYGLAIMDVWLYGGDPKNGLCYEDVLLLARKHLKTSHYSELLNTYFVKNERRVRVTLTPSVTLGERRSNKETEAARKRRSDATDDEIRLIKEKAEAFSLWQNTPDSEENLNTLPTLSISDIPAESDRAPTKRLNENGVEILLHEIPTDGIDYTELYFDISDLDEKELSDVSLLCSLLGKCRTEKYSSSELSKRIKADLGAFYATPTAFYKDGDARPYVQVFASSLESGSGKALDLLWQIVNSTDFTDKPSVSKVVKQKIISMREGFIGAGHSAAVRRAGAYVSSVRAITEYFFGIEMYRSLGATSAELASDECHAHERLAALAKKIFTRARLTVGFTGTPRESVPASLCRIPESEGEKPVAKKISPLGMKNEGVIIPSRVSYIGKCASLDEVGETYSGSMNVLSNILSYTHLWNSIRVQGGAYGAGFSVRSSSGSYVYSYRDPSPAASLKAADSSADFLRDLARDSESLDGFIIGAFGDYDALATPRSKGTEASGFALSGKTDKDEAEIRSSMLSFDKNELLRLADVTEKLMKNSGICVFGPKEHLLSCGDALKELIEI